MISGVITTRTLFTHGRLIVREFGFSTYIRCIVTVVRGEKTTFLALVWRR